MADANKEVVGECILEDVRLSFADIYKVGKARKGDDGKERPGNYGANFLMYKDDPLFAKNMAKLKKAGAEAKTKKWGDEKNWPKLKADKVCVRDGNEEEWDGYANAYYLSTNSNRQPQVITNRKGADKRWVPAVEGQEGAPYAGCRVNALVRLWGYQSEEHGKRLCASVEIVQYRGPGEAFGAAPVDPNERFGDEFAGETGSMGDDAEDDDSGLV